MSSKCQRCTRANRECVYTTHSKTRRRKRTDTRVKELEEKVRGLSMLLENKTSSSHQSSNNNGHLNESSELEVEEAAQDSDDYPSRGFGSVTEEGFSPLGLPAPQPTRIREATANGHGRRKEAPNSYAKDFPDPSPIFPDVVDRGILSMEKAAELHKRYVNELLPMQVSSPDCCRALRNMDSCSHF